VQKQHERLCIHSKDIKYLQSLSFKNNRLFTQQSAVSKNDVEDMLKVLDGF
jgi:hypothetical protein